MSCCLCVESYIATLTEGDDNEAGDDDITKYQRDVRPQPYSCTVCDKRFMTKSYWIAHKNLHTGENLYPCSQCER